MKKVFTFPAILMIALLFSKCTLQEDLNQLKGSLDSLQIVLGNPAFNTYVHVEFIDAKTKDYISGKTINVSLDGKNASDVYDNLGNSRAAYSSNIGFIDFVIDPHAIDTTTISDIPVEFDLTVEVDGYLGATQRIKINQPKLKIVTIELINLSSAPQGVSVAVNNNFGTSLSGTVSQTGVQTMNAGAQTVTVPGGTKLKDKDGNTISGVVKTEIVYFDPSSGEAVNSFPGGNNVSTVINNQEEQIQFISAGMFNVNITAGGTDVKTLENGGITLKTEVPATIINPNTGLPVKNGDPIELWSLDEGSGQWKLEKTDTIRLIGGKLVLEETVKHLSSWNWDFWRNTCTYGPKFIFKGDINDNITTTISVVGSSFNESTTEVINPSDTEPNINNYWDPKNYLQLYSTPSNEAATVTIKDTKNTYNFNPSTLNISNLCSGGPYEITVTKKLVQNFVTVNFDLTATSKTNASIVIKPNAYFYYRAPGSFYEIFQLISGKGTINLTFGTSYSVIGLFGNNYGTGTLKVDKTSDTMVKVTLTPNINFGNGTTTPVTQTIDVPLPENYVIDVKYNAVLSDDILDMLQ